ncbi:MAG: hypothetical protein ABR576_12285 [Thermoanaerobaculia bacterium]
MISGAVAAAGLVLLMIVALSRRQSSADDAARSIRSLAVLRASAGSQKEVQAELENLTRSREGNVLLVSEGEGTDGVAYRCASAPAETGGK